MVMPWSRFRDGQQFHDLDAAGGIEVAGRLIGQQHDGLGDDGAGDGDALLLAAGEFAGRVMFPAGQAHLLQGLQRPRMPLGRRCGDRSAAVRRSPAPRCG